MYENFTPVKLLARYRVSAPTFNDVFSVQQLLIIFGVNHPAQIRGVAKERLANKFIWQKITMNGRTGYIRDHAAATAAILDAVEAQALMRVSVDDAPTMQNYFLDPKTRAGLIASLQVSPRSDRLYQISSLPSRYPDLPIKDYLVVNEVCAILGHARETVYSLSDLRGPDIYGNERPLKTVSFQDRHFWLPDSVAKYQRDFQTRPTTYEPAPVIEMPVFSIKTYDED